MRSTACNKTAISIATLANPILFGNMGGSGNVQVDIIFMLAMNEPSKKINILQNIVSMIQNPDFLDVLRHASRPEEVVQIISAYSEKETASILKNERR